MAALAAGMALLSRLASGIKKRSKKTTYKVVGKKNVARKLPEKRYIKKAAVKNDGEGNKKIGKSYGKRLPELSNKLEQKIRMALTPIDTLVIQDVGMDYHELVDNMALGGYRVFEVGNVEDMAKIVDKSLGVNPDYDVETYVNDFSMQVKLINQMNTVVNIRLYEYVARNDLPKFSFGTTQVLVDEGFYKEDPHEVIKTTIGGTIFQNSTFCTYNRIVNVRTIQLAPGKEFIATLGHNKGQKINTLLYDRATTVTRQNVTKGYVLQYIGSPCNGHEGDAAKHLAGVGPYKVVWSQFKRYHFMNQLPAKGATYLIDNIPMAVEGVPQTGIPKWGSGQEGRILNQASGEVELTKQA